MHIKDINKLLNLQDINIVKISDAYENIVKITYKAAHAVIITKL